MSRFKRYAYLAVAVLSFVVLGGTRPLIALALSQNDLNAIYSDSVYYDPTSLCVNGGAADSTTGAVSGTKLSSGSSVYILGDSITVRTEALYQSAFSAKNIKTTINASVGRSWTGPGQSGPGDVSPDGSSKPGKDAVVDDSAKIKSVSGIIVALGSNGGLGGNPVAEIISTVRALNPTAPIWWVNTGGTSAWTSANLSYLGPFNRALADNSTTLNFSIIDWFHQINPGGDPYTQPTTDSAGMLADGLHPNDPKGTSALSSLVVSSTTGSSSGATASSGGSCACSASGGGGSTSLTGPDNQTKIWNYFIAKGLSPAGTAGIMGNMHAESTFVPSIEQVPGAWENMSSDSGQGVGLVQWDLSRRPAVIKYLQSRGLSDADFHQPTDKLLGAELDYVWQELTTSYTPALTALKQDTDPGQAAFDFHALYEISHDTLAQILKNRGAEAISLYAQFAGGSSGSGSSAKNSGSGGCGGGGGAADCSGVATTGGAAIACDALKYDPLSYSQAWHSSGSAFHSRCPTIGPSCATDCSGLVNIVLYDLYKNDMDENTYGEVADTVNFKIIPFSQVKPGDFIQPDPGHVEIIESIQGKSINTFGAHQGGVAQADQVGPLTGAWSDSPNNVYLRYIGQGSSGS